MKPEQLKIEPCGRLVRVWTLALTVAAAMIIAVRSSAATLYVSQTSTNPSPPYATPATAATNIQDAVNAASDGDTVLVSPGQYGLTNQVTITKAIALRSTMGAGQTFLNNLSTLNSTSSNIWCLWVSNSAAVVDGFSLQNTGGGASAAGAFLVGGTVQNCSFTNFLLIGQGRSVFMTGGILSNSIVHWHKSPIGTYPQSAVYCSSGGLVTDCQVLARDAAGSGTGVYLVDGRLENSIVLGAGGALEQTYGAAVYALSSRVVGCTITSNLSSVSGAGAYLDSCLMDRCVVADNWCASTGTPGIGGGGVFETNSTIRDSLIVSNSAGGGTDEGPPGFGGGVYMQGGALVNCTVSENRALNCVNPAFPFPEPAHGSGVYVESGGLTNCIIYSNFFYGCTNSENEWFNAGAGVFDHCCTTPDPGGVGNIILGPQFLDPTNGNFHLASNSPCIAAGAVQPWMIGAFDLDGNPRTTNGVVDMGAYQSPFAKPPPPPAANFSANPASGNAPLTVQFTDESTGAITSWNWDFGDGSADSPAQNPSHTYTNAGDYTVTLTVTGSGGSGSNSLPIHVTAQTPQQQIAALASGVMALFRQRALNRGQENTLLTRLREAENSISEGRDATACYEVGLFIKQVQADVKRGTLTQTEGQTLIDAAGNLRVALGCQ